MKRLFTIPYYGGKRQHLDFILRCLPKTGHFVDLFGGSAVVLLNRQPSPIETYNDADGRVVNFFRVVRDHSGALIAALSATPYAREEWLDASEQADDPVEDARRFVVRAVQSMNSSQVGGGWRYCVDSKSTARGMSVVCSAFQGVENRIPLIQRRLRCVQIENNPALRVLRRYDSPNTLFYVDPPYPHSTRNKSNAYRIEMNDDDHRELAVALHGISGLAVVSGYECDLYDTLYSDWRISKAASKLTPASRRVPRREVCWSNFD